MFNPAKFCLNNTRTAWVIYAVLMLSGIQSYLSIGRQEYPDFTIRNANIITTYPGRTSAQVEQQVTEPIEQAIRQMPEIKEIKSSSKNGVSIVTVELLDTIFDMSPIWQDLRNKVGEVQLPQGANTPEIQDDIGEVFPFLYALNNDGFEPHEVLDFAEDIRDSLLKVKGVAKVELHGAQEERIYLEYSSAKMEALGLSPDMIARELQNQNAVANSGTVMAGVERMTIMTKGEYASLLDIEHTRLTVPGEATSIYLSDIATVRRGYRDPSRSYSHFNGKDVICIAISMVKGGVVTEVGDDVQEEIDLIQASLPIGLDINRMFFQPEYVAESIRNFLINLGQAFFFVVLVMFLFAGYRIAVIVGVLVPSAVLMAFVFMPFVGVQLEMMSIAALIISLGLLVDNAVVVSEQILVKLSEGHDRNKATSEAVDGLKFPLLAASFTTIVAFLPIKLAPGGPGEFCYSLFAVVSLTLISSWLLSLTIIPLLCHGFLKPLKKDTYIGRGLNQLYGPYEKLLKWIIGKRWLYPALIVGATLLAVGGMSAVPNIFFPPNERGQFLIDLELPLGTDIEETNLQVRKLEQWLLTEYKDEIRSVSSWIGNGGPRWYLSLTSEPANPNYALINVLTHSDSPEDIQTMMKSILTAAIKSFPAARITPKALETGPPVGDPIQIQLSGPDMEELYRLRDLLVKELKTINGLYDIRDDWGAWTKQIAIEPDSIRMSRLNLSTSEIANSLNGHYRGQVATYFRENDKSIPVVLRSQVAFRNKIERMEDMPVYGMYVGTVPLSQVADLRIDFQPGSILRENSLRLMTIKARVRGRFASDALIDIQPHLEALTKTRDWTKGYEIEYGGEQKESAEAQTNIATAMPIAMALLSLILISQFNSIRCYIIIMCTIPPMMIGVVPGLLMTGSSFGFMTLLGMIALMGIIVNNAILLIDSTRLEIAKGVQLELAIMNAASSRLRPILMTTMTTIIGLVPLAIGGGGMWRSMSFAMIFGLGFATMLTLLLCPVLFFLLHQKRSRIET